MDSALHKESQIFHSNLSLFLDRMRRWNKPCVSSLCAPVLIKGKAAVSLWQAIIFLSLPQHTEEQGALTCDWP